MVQTKHRRYSQNQQTKKITKSSSNSTKKLAILLVVILFLGATFFFFYPTINNFLKERNTTTVVETMPENSISEVEESPEVITEETGSIAKGYYVIVGSFRDKNNAELMAKNLSLENIQLEIIRFEGLEVYRVSAGHYENITKAYNYTFHIQNMEEFSNAWVLEFNKE